MGANGSGKTSVLEALQVLTLTRGFRPDRELVQRGADYFALNAAFDSGLTWQCGYLEGKGKRILIDRQPLARLADHIGTLPVVSIRPEDFRLLEGGGTERRAWLNSLLAQSDHTYLEALIRYDRALKQRNELLQQHGKGRTVHDTQLEPYDNILAETTPILCHKRRAFLQTFLPAFLHTYQAVAQLPETATLLWDNPTEHPDKMIEELQNRRSTDRMAGRTTLGPHREDLNFLLEGVPVRHYGSQGQRKTFLLALKLAELRYQAAHSGKTPILLLDDVCDRLDAGRTAALFGFLHENQLGQVALTDTSRTRLEAAAEHAGLSGLVLHSLGS